MEILYTLENDQDHVSTACQSVKHTINVLTYIENQFQIVMLLYVKKCFYCKRKCLYFIYFIKLLSLKLWLSEKTDTGSLRVKAISHTFEDLGKLASN